jgi:hypothetical protein
METTSQDVAQLSENIKAFIDADTEAYKDVDDGESNYSNEFEQEQPSARGMPVDLAGSAKELQRASGGREQLVSNFTKETKRVLSGGIHMNRRPQYKPLEQDGARKYGVKSQNARQSKETGPKERQASTTVVGRAGRPLYHHLPNPNAGQR